jgi:hypothetical protein
MLAARVVKWVNLFCGTRSAAGGPVGESESESE